MKQKAESGALFNDEQDASARTRARTRTRSTSATLHDDSAESRTVRHLRETVDKLEMQVKALERKADGLEQSQQGLNKQVKVLQYRCRRDRRRSKPYGGHYKIEHDYTSGDVKVTVPEPCVVEVMNDGHEYEVTLKWDQGHWPTHGRTVSFESSGRSARLPTFSSYSNERPGRSREAPRVPSYAAAPVRSNLKLLHERIYGRPLA